MAVARYYSSNAVDTTLSVGISSSDLTMTVGSVSGLPGSYPFTLAIDYDTSNEELVDVTYASGTTLTITRAVDNTTAVAHSSAAPIKHVISGRDMREAQEHYNATGYYSVANGATTENFNLHGIASGEGNVVGTLKTQTLTSKTLTSPTINGGTVAGATLSGTTTNSGTISGGTINASSAATLTTARNINGVPFNGSADVTVPAAAGTLTGATLASGVTASSLTSFGANPAINGATITGTTTATSGTIAFGTNASAITANSRTISALELSQLDGVNQNIQDYMTYTGTWTTIMSGLSVSGGISAIGNGSLTGRICYIGNTAHIEITLTVGSTTTLVGSTNITITLPTGAEATQTPTWLIGNLFTSSGSKYNALNCRLQGTSLLPFGLNLGTSVLGELTALTTTSVQTITTGSVITINGTYETV